LPGRVAFEAVEALGQRALAADPEQEQDERARGAA